MQVAVGKLNRISEKLPEEKQKLTEGSTNVLLNRTESVVAVNKPVPVA